MQVISQKLRTEVATMTIIHTEERTFRPCLMLSVLRLHDIQNDGDSIFIVASDKPLIGICSVCPHDPVAPQAALCSFMIRHDNPGARLQRELACVLLLASLYGGIFMKHLIDIDGGEALDLGVHTGLRVQLLRHIDVLLVLLKESFQVKLAVRVHVSYNGG